MDFEFLELKLISGNEVHFKKKFRLSSSLDRDSFFYVVENKVGWQASCSSKKKGKKKVKLEKGEFVGDNWWL
jgi:hypothetical protein